jgi:hypothetical protein
MPRPRFATQISYEPLSRLRADPQNPRIPPRRLSADVADDERLRYIARHHDALAVAESIAEFGYFPSEPLIVVAEAGEDGPLIVVEGNRRLTALRGLTDTALRSTFTNRRRWDTAAEQASLGADIEVPSIRAQTRDAAAPLIGYRHIAGIQKWDAYPKARFISQMIDEGKTFDEVAERAAISSASARSLYRNYAILRQASEAFGLDTETVEGRFGVFTAALNRRPIRTYLGAPAPADVVPLQHGDEIHRPLPPDSGERLRTLLRWINGEGSKEPVIGDSRDLQRLAAVLDESDGIAQLEQYEDLEMAEAAVGLQSARVAEKLERARLALQSAAADAATAEDKESLRELVSECSQLIDALRRDLA